MLIAKPNVNTSKPKKMFTRHFRWIENNRKIIFYYNYWEQEPEHRLGMGGHIFMCVLRELAHSCIKVGVWKAPKSLIAVLTNIKLSSK